MVAVGGGEIVIEIDGVPNECDRLNEIEGVLPVCVCVIVALSVQVLFDEEILAVCRDTEREVVAAGVKVAVVLGVGGNDRDGVNEAVIRSDDVSVVSNDIVPVTVGKVGVNVFFDQLCVGYDRDMDDDGLDVGKDNVVEKLLRLFEMESDFEIVSCLDAVRPGVTVADAVKVFLLRDNDSVFFDSEIVFLDTERLVDNVGCVLVKVFVGKVLEMVNDAESVARLRVTVFFVCENVGAVLEKEKVFFEMEG